jgi:hypothetical protein
MDVPQMFVGVKGAAAAFPKPDADVVATGGEDNA